MSMQVYPTFKDFDPSEPISRVDTLLYEHMAGDKQQAKVSVECTSNVSWSIHS